MLTALYERLAELDVAIARNPNNYGAVLARRDTLRAIDRYLGRSARR